jgi:hypothetical protein
MSLLRTKQASSWTWVPGCALLLAGCLSTESGNPESADVTSGPNGASPTSATPGPVVPSPGASVAPLGTTPPSPSGASTNTPSPGAPSSSGPEPDGSSVPTPGPSPSVAPCEFSEMSDAGAALGDAASPGLRVYRCGALDGGVACTCGADPSAAAAPASSVLPLGPECESALLEQCGRALP